MLLQALAVHVMAFGPSDTTILIAASHTPPRWLLTSLGEGVSRGLDLYPNRNPRTRLYTSGVFAE